MTEMTTDDLVARAQAKADEVRASRQERRQQHDAESRRQVLEQLEASNGPDLEHELAEARLDVARLSEENVRLRRQLSERPSHARASDPVTSKRSASATSISWDTQIGQLARVYMTPSAREHGLTAFEAAEAAGLPDSWRRVSDLRTSGTIVDTGKTRLNPKGKQPMQVDRMPDHVFDRLQRTGSAR